MNTITSSKPNKASLLTHASPPVHPSLQFNSRLIVEVSPLDRRRSTSIFVASSTLLRRADGLDGELQSAAAAEVVAVNGVGDAPRWTGEGNVSRHAISQTN